MRTAIEIEKAIEELPCDELHKLFAWMEERQAKLAATAALFSIYDDEEMCQAHD